MSKYKVNGIITSIYRKITPDWLVRDCFQEGVGLELSLGKWVILGLAEKRNWVNTDRRDTHAISGMVGRTFW